MRLPGVKLYPQGLQLIPGQGVGLAGGCVGCGASVGVGVCVGLGIGDGVGVGRVVTTELAGIAA